MTKVSELVSANVGSAILNYQTWGSILISVKNPAYGAKGDGVTDDTAAIQAADAAATAAKSPLYFPSGTYKVTALILNAPKIYGAGWNATEIKGSTITDNVITLASGYTQLSDLKVTSSIAAASRTGAGIKVTSGVQVLLSRVASNGHKYGIWNQGQGNEFEHCFTASNSSHGFFIDGAVLAQNEIGVYFCQSNGNGGDGFNLTGPGLGVRMTNVTAASNTGWGINHSGGLNDVWITTPEISGNGGGINTVGNSDVQIVSPFIETSINNPNLWLGSSMCNVVGGFSQGAKSASLGEGVLINATDVSVVGMVISSNNHAGIRLGASSLRTTLSGNVVSNTATTGFTTLIGILVDAGAAAFTMSACDLAAITTLISGAVPAGSVIAACKGLTTSLGHGWLTSADAPVNGYITFVDNTGATRKVATIA